MLSSIKMETLYLPSTSLNGGLFPSGTHLCSAVAIRGWTSTECCSELLSLRRFGAPGAEQALIPGEQQKMLQPWTVRDQKDFFLQERLLLFPVPRLSGICPVFSESFLESIQAVWRRKMPGVNAGGIKVRWEGRDKNMSGQSTVKLGLQRGQRGRRWSWWRPGAGDLQERWLGSLGDREGGSKRWVDKGDGSLNSDTF